MRVLVSVLFLLGISACDRVLIPPSAAPQYSVSLKEMWSAIDEGYAHLENHPLVWDSVYSKLSASVDDNMSREAFYLLCQRMIDTLQDPEILLETGFSEYTYSLGHSSPRNFDEYLLETRYWKNVIKTGPMYHAIIDSVGYVYYPSFELVPTEAELDEVLYRFQFQGGTKGTILDLRGNESGRTENIFPLLSRIKVSDSLMDKSSFLFSTAYKSGPEHDAFTAYKDSWVEMHPRHFYGRFLILTNRSTKGAAHFFSGAAQAIRTVSLVGDTTGGGGSFLGTRELSIGWRIHFPASKTKMANGSPMKDGVVPHIRVDIKESDRLAGKDSIIEAALEELDS